MSLYDSLEATINEVLNNSPNDKVININFHHYENSTIYNNGAENTAEGLNINIENINTQPGDREPSNTHVNINVSPENIEQEGHTEVSNIISEEPEVQSEYMFPSQEQDTPPSMPEIPPPPELVPLPEPAPPILPLIRNPIPRYPHPTVPPLPPISPFPLPPLTPPYTPDIARIELPPGILNNFSFTFDSENDTITSLTNDLNSISNSLTETLIGSLQNISNDIGITVKETLNCTKVKLYKDIDLENKETACPICNEEYEDLSICRMNNKCKHFFHIHCIDNWYSNNIKCPSCNQIIF